MWLFRKGRGHSLPAFHEYQVTGDTWDQQPELRLQVLRLIAKFAVTPLEGMSGDAPETNRGILRTFSRGKRGGSLEGKPRALFWQEALEEIHRMPVS